MVSLVLICILFKNEVELFFLNIIHLHFFSVNSFISIFCSVFFQVMVFLYFCSLQIMNVNFCDLNYKCWGTRVAQLVEGLALGFPSGHVGLWDGDPFQVLELLGSLSQMISSPFAPPDSLFQINTSCKKR